MRIILTGLFLIAMNCLCAQDSDSAKRARSEDIKEAPLTIVERMPVFPGGDAEMAKFIQKNIRYPKKERDNNIAGTSYVTFVVEKDGTISNVRTLRGVAGGPGYDAEAIRVVESMPLWKPGMQNGRTVRVQYNLPIKFKL